MKTQIYPWQVQTWQAWQTPIAQNRLHHAILYTAPKGSGELELTTMLAKTLLCTKSDILPCEQCHSCLLFNANNHPDFHHLKPEAPSKSLGVDAVRASNKFAWQTSQLGGVRVILIEQADRMGESAANALLKTLEEPPKRCHFILLASSVSSMLPTIVSRCNKWISSSFFEQEAKAWLENELGRKISFQTLSLHAGAPLAAKSFIEQNKDKEHAEFVENFALLLTTKRNLFDFAEQIVKQENAFNWLSVLLLDAMKYKKNIEIVHCDLTKQVELIARLPNHLLISQLQTLNELSARLKQTTGLNAELLYSNWLTHFIYSESQPC